MGKEEIKIAKEISKNLVRDHYPDLNESFEVLWKANLEKYKHRNEGEAPKTESLGFIGMEQIIEPMTLIYLVLWICIGLKEAWKEFKKEKNMNEFKRKIEIRIYESNVKVKNSQKNILISHIISYLEK